MINEEEYTKVEIAALDNDFAALIKVLKDSVKDEEKVNSYLNRMYIDINWSEKSAKVTLADYKDSQFLEYIQGLLSGAVAVGFKVYVKEEK